MSLPSLLAVSLAAAPGPSAVGYAQATGYHQQESHPTLYQPLNLLDGLPTTAWCSPTADPLSELLTFGFDEPVQVDALKLVGGNAFDEATWASFGRPAKLKLTAGKESRTFVLEDVATPQTIALQPPLSSARFALELLDVHSPDDPLQPVCLADVIFLDRGKPLNGPWLKPRLRYDRSAQQLLGTWYAGYDGKPDRFLSFFVGGRFKYTFEPLDPGRQSPRSASGQWELVGAKLNLEQNGKRRLLGVSRKAGGKPGLQLLQLSGDIAPELKQVFRNVP